MFLIEGIDNNNFQNNLVLRPPIDAIEEFRILTGTFSAEYGRTAGGVVTVQMKSGTNTRHGSLFEFFRNDKLDANNFFDNQVPLKPGLTKASRAPLRRNQFGGTFGGPIVKNKLFFFGDYQGLRDIAGHTGIYSVPTPLERTGDFSQTLAPAAKLFQNALTGVAYPDLKIPASDLDPAAVKLINLYPLPNIPGRFISGQGTINNFTTNASTSRNIDQFDIKLDYMIGSKDTLAGHYNFSKSADTIPAAYGKVGPCVGCGVVLDLLAGSPSGRSQNFGITEVHTFAPNVVNEFRAGVNRTSSLYNTSDGGTNLSEQIGIKNVNVSPLTTGLPWFLFSPGPSWMGTSPFTPAIGGYTAYQLTNNVSYLISTHSFKFGFEARRRDNVGSGNFFGKGFYLFSNFFTGNSVADFLTGRPLVIQQDLTPGTVGHRGYDYGFYAQDDWKVTRRLTLNLGLRYDVFPAVTENYDRMSNLDPVRGVVALAGLNGEPRNFVDGDFNNFGPRIGFAYALTSKANTVLRGGYGISYINAHNHVTYAGLNPPYTQAFNQFNLSSTTADAIFRISDGLPTQLIVPPDRYNVRNPSGSFRLIERQNRTPYTQYFSLNVQRALPGNVVFDVGYVGTKGTRLPGEVEGNPTPPGPPATIEQRRLYRSSIPNVGSVTYYINAFSSIYHSLQVKAEKRMSSGLQFLSTYTWSKSIDNKSGSAVTGGSDSNPGSKPMNPFNWDGDRSLSSFDRRHRFVLAFNYQLPFGRGKMYGASSSPALNAVIGGWSANGIYQYQSGLPFSVFATSAASCGCTASDMRPDRIGDGNLASDKRSVSAWFDSSAFRDPAPGTYGNAGRNIIFGPDSATLDFSLFKEFAVHEQKRFQLRGEFFNLLNRTNFLFPVQTNANWRAGGVITEANPPRRVQLALKFVF